MMNPQSAVMPEKRSGWRDFWNASRFITAENSVYFTGDI